MSYLDIRKPTYVKVASLKLSYYEKVYLTPLIDEAEDLIKITHEPLLAKKWVWIETSRQFADKIVYLTNPDEAISLFCRSCGFPKSDSYSEYCSKTFCSGYGNAHDKEVMEFIKNLAHNG